MAPIVAKAINDAILGNDAARKWLSEYAWGKPAQAIDLTSFGKQLLIADTDDEE